jgi:sucrose-6-phosphate hydrolase SacC (GH32 family)
MAKANGNDRASVPGEMILSFHLMHPGGDSEPGDPNAAFHLDGTCHLHYILRHPWRGRPSYSFVHVSSPDMLHWRWHPTRLQPAFTGHGMFSGTGFVAKDGRPAVVYHGQGADQNFFAVAKDRTLADWEKAYPQEVASAPPISFWDPDCFLVGDTYYAISGGRQQPLLKSTDLKSWTYVGDFLARELPDVVHGEDISCPNFFPLEGRWMLLCISHPFGCRYYLGDWDPRREQFVPTSHGRMNWPRPDQSIYDTVYRDFFAPESVLTPDGRRVMWAWLRSLNEEIGVRTIQSLPRELALGPDGRLRIRPLRELESLRHDRVLLTGVTASPPVQKHSATAVEYFGKLEGDSCEIRITVDRSETRRKRFAIRLFADEAHEGLPIMLRPESGTLRVGATEAPFSVDELPEDEDLELRIFVDRYLVEVFAAGRQAMVAAHMDYRSARGLALYAYGAPVTLRSVEIWKLRPTNQGFLEARQSRIWAPQTE